MRLIIEMILLMTLLQQHKGHQQVQSEYLQIMVGSVLCAEGGFLRLPVYVRVRLETVGK